MPGNCVLEERSSAEKDKSPALLLDLHGPQAGVRTCACAHVRAKSHETSMSKVRGLPIKAIVFTWVVELMALNAAYFS